MLYIFLEKGKNTYETFHILKMKAHSETHFENVLFHKKEPIAGLYKRDFGLCTFAVVACNYFKCWLRFATQWSEIKKFTQKLKTIFFHVIYMLSKIKYNLFSKIGKHY